MTYGIIDANLLNSQLQAILASSRIYVPNIKTAALVMYHTGCRAVESITLSRWERLSPKSYILTPQKGNNSRVISNTFIPDIFDNAIRDEINIFNGLNYDKLRYHINEAFINRQYKIGGKDSVCHVFRHNYAKRLHAQGYSDEDIQHDMGEVNIESAQGYIYSEVYGYY